MKTYLLPVFFLFSTLQVCGQQPAPSVAADPYPDSLQRLLKKTPTDTGKALLFFLLSDYWSDKDSAKAFRYIDQYFQLRLNKEYYDGLAHFYLAGAWFDYDYDRSQKEYKMTDQLLSPLTTPAAFLYRSRAWHNYGALEQLKDNNKEFIDILLNKAIPLAQQAGDMLKVAWDYKEVGEVFMNFAQYDKARIYYNKAIRSISRPAADNELLADCYISAAKANLLNNSIPPAGPLLDTAWLLLSPTPLSTFLPAWYWVMGMYYSKAGEGQRALDSLDKGLDLARRLNREYDASSLLFEKYYVYQRQKKFAAARKILQVVYEMNRKKPLANNKKRILYELARTEAALGNMDSAYRWMSQYAEFSDSLFVKKTATEISSLEARYRSSEKEKEILELHNNSQIQKILLAGSGVLFAGILLFLLYRFRLKRQQADQQLRSLQQQQQIEVAGALLNGEERERQRLARDLHDGLGGMLASIKINLSEIAFNSPQGADNHALQKIIRQLDNSVKDLRFIAHNLMPESLLRSGLEIALTDLCESVATEKIQLEFQMMNISKMIPKQTQLLLYRIVQELLANVLKHANATEIFVQCSQSDNLFYITVEDDGDGFDKALINQQKGIGLENIRHRVDFLKGKLEIESAPGKGTIINIEINVI